MAATAKSMKTVQSKAALTRDERRAAGKALRDKLSRTAHAEWKAPAHRRDPAVTLWPISGPRHKPHWRPAVGAFSE